MDPDLQIRGRGHPDPEIRGRRSQKNFFRPFGPQFGLKIRAPRARPLNPPLMNSGGYEMIYELDWVFFYYVLLSTTLRWSKLHEMVPSRRLLSDLER